MSGEIRDPSQVVWKFPLEITDEQDIAMPFGSRLLHVGEQGGRLMLWAAVNRAAPLRGLRRIFVSGTGYPVPGGEHIGSVAYGVFMWHVWDGGEQ